jgi:hypothetical protein
MSQLVFPGAALVVVRVLLVSAWMARADRLAREVGAFADAVFVAPARAAEAPIWALDRKFSCPPGVTVRLTKEIGAVSAARPKVSRSVDHRNSIRRSMVVAVPPLP